MVAEILKFSNLIKRAFIIAVFYKQYYFEGQLENEKNYYTRDGFYYCINGLSINKSQQDNKDVFFNRVAQNRTTKVHQRSYNARTIKIHLG